MKPIKNIFSAFKLTSYLLMLTLFSCVMIIVSSCGKKDPNSPGVEYMPDMYRSASYETYSANPVFADSISAQKPVMGTIPRGFMPYSYPNDTTGYSNAGKYLKNPIAFTPQVLAEGEVLYTKFCVHCHGIEGKGDGPVGLKLPGAPPSYSGVLKNLPEGKIFHSITYGKNLMGAHNALLSQEETWKIAYYVQKLQALGTTSVATDSTATVNKAKK